MSTYRLAVTGDVILNSRPSVCGEPDVLAVLDLLRGVDVVHAHLEIPLHDFPVDAETFGSAEGALSWMRGPTTIADELRALGVDLVSTASNHSLDFSYGGLRSTVEALDAAGLAHAGTGRDLAAARAPAITDTAFGRVALVSATSSFPAFARAGDARSDTPGRPGVNPLRCLHVVDQASADQLFAMMSRLGMWVVRDGDEFVVHPPGMHNSIWGFRIADDAADTVCDPDDLTGNLDAIRYAVSVSDFVIAHLHVHAWDAADGRMSSTPAFAREYAHAAVDAGAAVVLIQGSHAPMRGIEVHRGVPILYDPGPLFRLGLRETQPHDFYLRWGNPASVRSADAGLLDAFGSRDMTHSEKVVISPLEGNAHEPGAVLPILTVDPATQRVTGIDLHPHAWRGTTRAATGFPTAADPARAAAILARMAELSAPYGTTITVRDGVGRINVANS